MMIICYVYVSGCCNSDGYFDGDEYVNGDGRRS